MKRFFDWFCGLVGAFAVLCNVLNAVRAFDKGHCVWGIVWVLTALYAMSIFVPLLSKSGDGFSIRLRRRASEYRVYRELAYAYAAFVVLFMVPVRLLAAAIIGSISGCIELLKQVFHEMRQVVEARAAIERERRYQRDIGDDYPA